MICPVCLKECFVDQLNNEERGRVFRKPLPRYGIHKWCMNNSHDKNDYSIPALPTLDKIERDV